MISVIFNAIPSLKRERKLRKRDSK